MTAAPESPRATPPERRFLPWYRRWLPGWRTVAVFALLLLAVPYGVRTYRLSRMPDVPVPFDREAFFALPEDIEDNANFFFEQAKANYDPSGQTLLFLQWWESGGPITWEEVPESSRTWAAEQRLALKLYRRAAQCPTCVVLPPKLYRFSSSTPSAEFHWGIPQVVVIETLRLMDEGDTNAAAELLHDAFRASRHASNRAGPNGDLGGGGHYFLMPVWHMWSRHPNVTAEQLTAALTRLRRDWELTPPPSDQLKIEYATLVNETKPPQTLLVDTFFRQLNDYCIREYELAIGPWGKVIPGRFVLWSIGEPELSLRAARLLLAHELKTCDLPLAQRPPRFPDGAQLRQTDDVIGGLTSAELNQRIGEAMFTELSHRRRTEFSDFESPHQTLLETELRLQQIYREQSCISRNQAESLLATFEWPVDPTDPLGGVVRHLCSEEGVRIWCVGSNGIDDQGEFPKRNNPGDVVVIIPWPAERE